MAATRIAVSNDTYRQLMDLRGRLNDRTVTMDGKTFPYRTLRFLSFDAEPEAIGWSVTALRFDQQYRDTDPLTVEGKQWGKVLCFAADLTLPLQLAAKLSCPAA